MSITTTRWIVSFTACLFAILLLLVPQVSYSAETGNTGITYECNNGNPGDCTFEDLILAVKKVVDKAVILAMSFSVVAIAYAGFLYMQSGENPGERKKANKMLLSVVKGIVFILAAWLIVSLIANALLRPDVVQFGM